MRAAAKDIDSYIEMHPDNVKVILHQIRQTIIEAVPEAEELISYQMPAFRFHGILVWFAAFNKHYSIFIRRNVLQRFYEELKPYELTRSGAAIKIPVGKEVPAQLLTKILIAAAEANLETEKLKKNE